MLNELRFTRMTGCLVLHQSRALSVHHPNHSPRLLQISMLQIHKAGLPLYLPVMADMVPENKLIIFHLSIKSQISASLVHRSV